MIDKTSIDIFMPHEDFLIHYGVLGMKWGVRKKEPRTGRQRKTYSIPKDKSGHRVRLEANYLKKGFSVRESEQLAANRIRTEKILLGVLGTAVATSAALAAYKYHGQKFVGVTLEKGKDLRYINSLGEKADYDRRLYTSFLEKDTQKYRGLYAATLRKRDGTDVFETVLKTTETIKAPSQAQAAKIWKEVIKTNPEFKGISYNTMNQGIVGNPFLGIQSTESATTFMKALKTKGYNAVLDANDQFISGYGTKKPLILLNAKSSTVKVGESVISKQLSDKLNAIQLVQVSAKQMAPMVGVGAAFVGGTKALDTNTKYGAVARFIDKNPSTTQSYGEVYNALKSNDGGLTYYVDKKLLQRGA